MVVKHSSLGLIASTRSDSTQPLNDLADCCDWPLLLGATPRRLQHELSQHDPECVLFWLDDPRSVTPTAKLIAWSRDRGARPIRVAVAFQMDGHVEAVFRAAGAHSFFPIVGHSMSFVADALLPMLQRPARSIRTNAHNLTPVVAENEHGSTIEFPSDLMRPP